MKRNLLFFTLMATTAAQAQKSSSIYEVTDPNPTSFNWTAIRQVVSNGQGNYLLDNKLAAGTVWDAKLQKKVSQFSPTAANVQDQPMFTGVAALAFDKEHNRLYYSTMFTEQLRYVTLGKSQSSQYFNAGNIKESIKTRDASYKVGHDQQGPVVTRMTIGADGYGYGISNDGNSFFRFSLDKKTIITELGALIDDASNGAISVHTQCTSWGGDIVAAEDGSLYLFTYRQHVFQIDPATRVAKYLGQLKGLEQSFTVNGAAVDDDGNVMLSTAAYAGTRAFVTDMNNLETNTVKGLSCNSSSDLASGNLLFTGKKVTTLVLDEVKLVDAKVAVYPNPVTNGVALLQFDKLTNGRFTVQLVNAAGNVVQSKPVTINTEGQQMRLSTTGLAKGLYIVKVNDAGKKEVFSSKLVVQ